MSFASIRKRFASLLWRARRPDDRLDLGRRGERAAGRFLQRKNHHILARNYRCALGEIDLVCADGDTLVFVEVKTRSSDVSQDVQEAIRPDQWRKIERAARFYLTRQKVHDPPCRFDVVTVLWADAGPPSIEHFEDVYHPRQS